MKKLATILIGGMLAVNSYGCDASKVPYSDQWQHDDQVRHETQAWSQAHDGYTGAFACHTADGGCLHMTCTTEKSCDYMQAVEKKCAAPVLTDPKVIAKVVVADDSCKSVERDTSSSVVSGGGTIWVTNGTTAGTVDSGTH